MYCLKCKQFTFSVLCPELQFIVYSVHMYSLQCTMFTCTFYRLRCTHVQLIDYVAQMCNLQIMPCIRDSPLKHVVHCISCNCVLQKQFNIFLYIQADPQALIYQLLHKVWHILESAKLFKPHFIFKFLIQSLRIICTVKPHFPSLQLDIFYLNIAQFEITGTNKILSKHTISSLSHNCKITYLVKKRHNRLDMLYGENMATCTNHV